MADVIVTLKIMPEGVDVDLDALQKIALEKIAAFAGEGETKVSIEPVAFGLNSLNIIFVTDEAKGSTDPLEAELVALDEVASAEVTDVRRAIG